MSQRKNVFDSHFETEQRVWHRRPLVQVSLYHHQLTQAMHTRCGRMNSPLELNTRSTGAEVAGEQKTSKSACKTLYKCWVSPGYGPQFFRFFFTVHRCKTMVLDISHSTLAYSIFENFRGLELLRTRTWKLVLEDPRGQGLSSRTTTLQTNF